jgi:hypothetical protein
MIKDRDQSTERVGRVTWTELGIGSFAFEIPTEYQYYEFDESMDETHDPGVNGVYEILERRNLMDEYTHSFTSSCELIYIQLKRKDCLEIGTSETNHIEQLSQRGRSWETI